MRTNYYGVIANDAASSFRVLAGCFGDDDHGAITVICSLFYYGKYCVEIVYGYLA
jgi:hypothetical protein